MNTATMKTLLIIIFTAITSTAWCQQPPVGVMPMHYNSSFAGSSGNSRISSNIFYSNRNSSGYYNNSRLIVNAAVSYDGFFPKIRSGIGITVNKYTSSIVQMNNSDEYKINDTNSSISFDIAPKISIRGKYTISPSLRVSYLSSNLDLYGSDPDWFGRLEEHTWNGFSSRIGLLFNTGRYYIGYSVNLFSSDSDHFAFGSFYSYLQLGYSFQRQADSKFSFTPQLVLGLQCKTEFNNKVSFPSLNLGFRYGQFLASLLAVNSDFVPSFQLGWQKNGWRILTTHEFNMYFNGVLYSPSLGLRYIFNQGKESKHIYENNF